MVCAPVRSIIPSLKLGDYLSVQAHKPCSLKLGIISPYRRTNHAQSLTYILAGTIRLEFSEFLFTLVPVLDNSAYCSLVSASALRIPAEFSYSFCAAKYPQSFSEFTRNSFVLWLFCFRNPYCFLEFLCHVCTTLPISAERCQNSYVKLNPCICLLGKLFSAFCFVFICFYLKVLEEFTRNLYIYNSFHSLDTLIFDVERTLTRLSRGASYGSRWLLF